MRPQGTTRQLEKRRHRAIRLWKRGKSLCAVAGKLHASRSSIWRWVRTYQQQGLRGLRPKPTPGRPSHLSRPEKEQLAQVLLRGARAMGYRTELWTLGRIAKVIWRQFRVRYHPHAVWYLLRTLGWSGQKPTPRAQQRDEAAIVRWRQYLWPHIKKGCPARGALGFPG